MNANQVIQRTAGIGRQTVRQGERVGRRVLSDAFGLAQRARHLRSAPKPGMDDVTLARKVETELFREAGSPKATVDVNVVDGVVWLRGEVKHPDDVRQLERRALAIPEVRGVENLLHLRKTPAPAAPTPRAASSGRARRPAAPSPGRTSPG